jgi:hypothetical protein
MIKWEISGKNKNKLEDDTPSTNTVQSDSLTAIERFVRELTGNSRDSIDDRSKPVHLTFSFIDIEGDEKKTFIKKLKLENLYNTYEELEKDEVKISRIFLGEKPTNIFDYSKPLRILIVKDKNTKGLLGPEFYHPRYRDQSDLRFIGLCRFIGKNSIAEGHDSTGSWGYGKSVIWSNNNTRIALFNSKLVDPFSDTGGVTITNRAIGHLMVPDYVTDDDKAYSGDIYFGLPEDDGSVKSIWNDESSAFANDLNINDFKVDVPGTAIMIPGFEPGDGGDYTTEQIVSQFKDAVVKYFWPAIISKELEVEIKFNGETQNLNVSRHPDFKEYIKIYEKLLDNPKEQDKNFKLIEAKGPRSTINAHIGLYVTEARSTSLVNRIAKIRGTRMVIEYGDPRISGASGNQMIGVAMAGALINEIDNVDSEEQYKIDKLLKDSEPISHHKWDDKNPKLKKYGGSAAIKKINSNINRFFKAMIKESRDEPAGEHRTLLANLFSIDGPSEGPGPRSGETTYTTTKRFEKSVEGSKSKYIHSIEFRTKKKSDYKHRDGKQMTHISFDTNFRVIDESGKNLSLDDFNAILGFKVVSLSERVFNDDAYENPVAINTIRPVLISKPLNLDNKYREYIVEWESNEIENEIMGILIIKPNYVWKLGVEE